MESTDPSYYAELRKELTSQRTEIAARRRFADIDKLRTLDEQIASLERKQAIYERHEAATPIVWALPWASYPEFKMFATDFVLEISYRPKEILGAAVDFAVVTFRRYRAVRLSNVNDEIFESQPLSHRGLRPMQAHLVENSRWIHSLRAQHEMHRGFQPKEWENAIHYILIFKDRTFECIAEGFEMKRIDIVNHPHF